MTQNQQVIPLRGGLDLVTPAMMIGPGRAVAAENYEVEARGYRRMAGYERYDGRVKPSEPIYHAISFIDGSTVISDNDVVTGGTSGATGKAVRNADLSSGAYADSDAIGIIYVTDISGTFQSGEDLNVSSSTVAEASSVAVLSGAPDDDTDNAINAIVISKRRTAIAKPAGSGPVRGVATYAEDVYCWRDNADSSAGVMFKATTSGWAAQDLGHFLRFDAAVTAFVVGETVTGGTSGATATVARSVLSTGAYDGAGTGLLALSGVTGTFSDNEGITSTAGEAVANGGSAAIALPAGGQYRHIENNFYGTVGSVRLYFVNGVGRAHEWDGTTLTPTYTGLTDAQDKPEHVAIHRNHLFLGFATGSVQHSSIDDPVAFEVSRGAGEIGFGQPITGMASNTRDALIITAKNKLGYLTGSSSQDFNLQSLSEDSGAVKDTLQVVGKPIFLDDQGVRDMTAAQTFGDWLIGTKTQMVEPLLRTKRDALVLPVGSVRVRAKDQYRLFFNDGSGLLLYFGRKSPEAMPFQLAFTPYTITSGEDVRGNEILFAAGADGHVYQMDVGTSFDGASITAFLRLSFLNQGAPNAEKRYHRARVEGQADGRTDMTFVSDFSYGSPDLTSGISDDFTLRGGGGFLNNNNWNEFVWSAQVEGQAYAELNGIGENVSVAFVSDVDDEAPHTLSTLTIFYSKRRRLR